MLQTFCIRKNIVDIDFYPMSTMHISIHHRIPDDLMLDIEPAHFNDIHEWRQEDTITMQKKMRTAKNRLIGHSNKNIIMCYDDFV